MKTYDGTELRMIRDSDVVLLRSRTHRPIMLRLPVFTAGEVRRNLGSRLEPFMALVGSGRAMRTAGLEKELDRGDVTAQTLPKPTEELDKLARKTIALFQVELAEADKLVAKAEVDQTDILQEQQMQQQQQNEQNAEQNAALAAEFARINAERARFEQTTELTNAVTTLETAIKLDQAGAEPPMPVSADDIVITREEEPAQDSPVAATLTVVGVPAGEPSNLAEAVVAFSSGEVEAAQTVEPAPAVESVPAVESSAPVAERRSKRPKKRD